MQLSRLAIAGFRGIDDLGVDFEDTTVLIGENNTGKSSVLRAMAICLGVGQAELDFEAADFRQVDGAPGPVHLELEFVEEERGEWKDPVFDPLRPAVQESPRGPARLRVAIDARLAADGSIEAGACFLGRKSKRLDLPEGLATLRALCPMVWLDADRRIGMAPPENGEPADLDPVEARINEVYRRLADEKGPVPPEELAAGFEAMHAWIDRMPEQELLEDPPRRLLRDLVQTPVSVAQGPGPQLRSRLRGSGTQSVALLVLSGALLEARGSYRFPDYASPILAVEEPETHLHPLMLTSIWSLVSGLPAQKILTTNSSEFLASVPLRAVRRLTRREERVHLHRLGEKTLGVDEMRRVAYHVRVKRGGSFFARCWLLVEGETEFWLLPELARLCGNELPNEGVALVEFAQCGPGPLVKLANDLGIEWHLFVDGDTSGKAYAEAVRGELGGRGERERITVLKQHDVERMLWSGGYADVYRKAAGAAGRRGKQERPERVIDRAVRAKSKPYLALEVIRAASAPGSPGVPEPVRAVVERVVSLARDGA
jgi:putative ATP-dependent endonuclease of OLD family